MKKIAVIGFQHETNTFSSVKTTLQDFQLADAWPGLLQGHEMIEQVRAANLPTAGFIEASAAYDWELVPLLWCSAAPSGPVEKEAFEWISERIISLLSACDSLSGIYLDLHGAMVCEHVDNGEGELLSRIRRRLGHRIPIVCSLDFHANVTAALYRLADGLAAYRTYPHIDMANTGRRAARHLANLLAGKRYRGCHRQLNFLIPLLAQCTEEEPMQDIMEFIATTLERDANVFDILFTPGFPLADTYDTGPSVIVYSNSDHLSEHYTHRVTEYIGSRKHLFDRPLYSIDSATRLAVDKYQTGEKPIILVDTQDNPGCGGSSDTTGILQALSRLDAENVVAGIVCDPDFAEQAHRAGEGAVLKTKLGGYTNFPGNSPWSGEFTVVYNHAGIIHGAGPFYNGCKMDLGLMTLVSIGGIKIVVSSRKQQAADRALFSSLGIDFALIDILVLKSSVHYKADFRRFSNAVYVVEAPGLNIADIRKLHYRFLRPAARSDRIP